ncbi:hypothetical protein BLOT_003485 [Blomia tropicalis]|nr:hypothetical protein BLOT_003485 [Blomia tropicalis]
MANHNGKAIFDHNQMGVQPNHGVSTNRLRSDVVSRHQSLKAWATQMKINGMHVLCMKLRKVYFINGSTYRQYHNLFYWVS